MITGIGRESIDYITSIVCKYKKRNNIVKFKNALGYVLSYDGELEDKKIKHTFKLGKRTIYVPTEAYSYLLKNFNILIKGMFPNFIKSGVCNSLYTSKQIVSNEATNKCIEQAILIRDRNKVNSYKININKEKDIVIKFDIQKAYENCSYKLVESAFLSILGIKSNRTIKFFILDILNKIKYLFHDNHLLQGFSTSAYLFEIVQSYLDEFFTKSLLIRINNYISQNIYCNKCYNKYFNFVCNPADSIYYYTITSYRYVDDVLCILKDTHKEDQINCANHYDFIIKIIDNFYRLHGFRIKKSKTILYHKDKRRYIKYLNRSIIGNNKKDSNITLSNKARKKLKALKYKINAQSSITDREEYKYSAKEYHDMLVNGHYSI